MPQRLKRKKSLAVVNKDGVEISSVYCRKCCQTKPPKDFYLAVDKFLDKNGFMSVCKSCCSEIYVGYYNSEHSLERAIYKTCQVLNIAYLSSAVDAVKTQVQTQERLEDDESIFGIYKTKIVSTTKGKGAAKMSDIDIMDLTFKPEVGLPAYAPDDKFNVAGGIKEQWGDNLSPDDYRFLEQEFSNFKRTHKADTYAEIVLLKEVCYKMLEIKKGRETDHSTASHIRELQELMKNLAISPNMANQASSGKSQECFGVWIKDIENTRPAELFEDKDIYRDVDNIEEYNELFISSLKNFVTGSRDFGTDELGELLDGDDSSEEG